MNDASRQGAGAAVENTSEIPVNVGTGQEGVITVVTEALLDDGTTAMIKVLIKKSDGGTGSSPFQVLKWQRNHRRR